MLSDGPHGNCFHISLPETARPPRITATASGTRPLRPAAAAEAFSWRLHRGPAAAGGWAAARPAHAGHPSPASGGPEGGARAAHGSSGPGDTLRSELGWGEESPRDVPARGNPDTRPGQRPSGVGGSSPCSRGPCGRGAPRPQPGSLSPPPAPTGPPDRPPRAAGTCDASGDGSGASGTLAHGPPPPRAAPTFRGCSAQGSHALATPDCDGSSRSPGPPPGSLPAFSTQPASR